jgi:hypothetical protein
MNQSFTKNQYKKFLIDEIIRCSNHDLKHAISEVNIFSATNDFERSYKKWRFLQWEKDKYYVNCSRPKSIQEILQSCTPKKNAKKYSVV